MQQARNRIAKGITWGFIVPLALALIALNILTWTSDARWLREVGEYTVNAVILGFAAILAVQALKDPPTARKGR